MKSLIALSALGVAPLLAGCASIGAHCEGPSAQLYPGVRGDAHCLAHPEEVSHPMMGAVDLPFSAVGDTLFLPCDLVAYALHSRHESSLKETKTSD